MKLFIWDDYEWRLIEDSDEYDKKKFSIVRTLFVQWPKENGSEACNDDIRKYFELYGNVELVETVNGQSVDESASITPNIHEAYVTYVRSSDAFMAFSKNRVNSNAIKVLPADTWHQAGFELKDFGASTFVSDTTHHCNDPKWPKHEVRAIDLDELSNLSDHFCEHTELTLRIPFEKRNLKIIRKTVRPLKLQLRKLTLDFDFIEKDINCLSFDEYIKRVVEILCSSVGDKFCSLSINGPALTTEMLDNFTPMLRRLTELSATFQSTKVSIYDLRDYCPSLEDLLIFAKSWERSVTDIRHWPSLTVLAILGEMKFQQNSEDGRRFGRFIELNPQIETLEITVVIDIHMCKLITEKLPKLKIFTFVRETYTDIDLVLDMLGHLKQLEMIKMSILNVKKGELWAMVKCAEKLRKMELKTGVLFQNYDPDSVIAEQYDRLITHAVKLHDDCECHESKRVVEFSDTVGDITIPHDGPMFIAIVNSVNFNETGDEELFGKIFHTAQATEQFYPNSFQPIIAECDDTFTYIFINCA
ncbi:uncharacterized protein LOC116338162 [Contarinia nasturtii]|uniref:uncharacterized protein LOC116338162 n=1 Tax=Contarinia nasturtii TaxID=265458 RepID=UPI0012D37D49|nr:uncharacterized protein LOC116338162 [Contarinia nasturtii]